MNRSSQNVVPQVFYIARRCDEFADSFKNVDSEYYSVACMPAFYKKTDVCAWLFVCSSLMLHTIDTSYIL